MDDPARIGEGDQAGIIRVADARPMEELRRPCRVERDTEIVGIEIVVDGDRCLFDPLGGRVGRAVGQRQVEGLAPGQVLKRDRPETWEGLTDVGVDSITGHDRQRDLDARKRDRLPPGGVMGGAGGVHVLLGAGLDEGGVSRQAAGVDAATADADPGRRVLVLARPVRAGGGYRPVAGDGVELFAALLQEALVVAGPVG